MKGLIFTYVLTFGGAVSALINPFIALLVYVCFAIVKPDVMWYWAVPEGNYSRIVAGGLLIGWALHGFGRWTFGRAAPIVASLLGLLAWNCISALQAVDHEEAWSTVEGLVKIVLPFVVGITIIDSVSQLVTLAWTILLSQGYVALELNLSYYEGFNRVWELGFAGMDNNCVAIAMVTCTGLAFFLGLHTKRWWAKLASLTLAVLMIHVVLIAYSRGGMIALIVTAAVTFVLIPKRPLNVLMLGLMALVAIRLAGPTVQDRFATTFASHDQRDASAQSRLDMWENMWDCAQKNPVFGVGPHNFPSVVHEYGWPAGKEGHSLWLQALAELGIPGFLCYVFFYGLTVTRLFWSLRSLDTGSDPSLGYLARMVIASIVGFAVAAQFVSLFGLEVPYYIALIGAGILKLSSPRFEPDATEPTKINCFEPQLTRPALEMSSVTSEA